MAGPGSSQQGPRGAFYHAKAGEPYRQLKLNSFLNATDRNQDSASLTFSANKSTLRAGGQNRQLYASPQAREKRAIAQQHLEEVRAYHLKTSRQANRSPLVNYNTVTSGPVAIIDTDRAQAERMEHVLKLGSLRDFISKKEGRGNRRGRGILVGASPDMEGDSLM